MKVHYRIINDEIEIVRCFGTDPEIAVPAEIDGRVVKRMAPYAFSARYTRQADAVPVRADIFRATDSGDDDIFVYETEANRMFCSEERLLAGDVVEKVTLPDTMEELGRYIFYGCRNLKTLCFSDRLKNIGSGAFTGCRSLAALQVRLLDGKRSCVPDILGDLWQRIDVTFYGGGRYGDGKSSDGKYAEGEDRGWKKISARLVFPEHYEEAVENTPARLLFTQHHGSGNNYRQCFYNKEIDFRKYDGLFYSARAQEQTDVITDLVFSRLMYPAGLTEEARKAYEDYIRERALQTAEHLINMEDMAALKVFSERSFWTAEALSGAAEYAVTQGKREALSFLMNEKHRLFPEKKKKYEL